MESKKPIVKGDSLSDEWNNIFLILFYDLIELELPITKISFLALVSSSFRSKTTKFTESVDFVDKRIFSQIGKLFYFALFFTFLK